MIKRSLLALPILLLIIALFPRSTTVPKIARHAKALPAAGPDDPISSIPAERADASPASAAPVIQPQDEAHALVQEAFPPGPLRWLVAHQNADGSWGEGAASLEGLAVDQTGMTGLGLLAFLGAGYSHLSKDKAGEKTVGESVKAALKWLLAKQDANGAFPSSGDAALNHAIASLAISETYGMSGTQLFKEPADRSLAALQSMQHVDGSWGSSTKTFWAAMALKSAEISDVKFEADSYARSAKFFEQALVSAPTPHYAVGEIFLNHRKGPALDAVAGQVLAAQTPGIQACYVGSLMLFQYDGPKGPAWKQWTETQRGRIAGMITKDGSIPGNGPADTVLNTTIGMLCQEIYYRYEAVK